MNYDLQRFLSVQEYGYIKKMRIIVLTIMFQSIRRAMLLQLSMLAGDELSYTSISIRNYYKIK